MGLSKYNQKRKFEETPEPSSDVKKGGGKLIFVVQRHQASRLHYDLRLEMEGVLKSWAVPKGPSMNSKDKRLAMMVEDHPFDYKDFEGEIPEGNYGAGIVEIWDNGFLYSYEDEDRKKVEKDLLAGLEKGDLKFRLEGEKLKGTFALVKIKNNASGSDKDNSWLLIKKNDEHAVTKRYDSEDYISKSSKIDKGGNKKSKKSSTSKKETKTTTRLKSTSKAEIHPEGAKKSQMPLQVKPMLAKLGDEAFNDSNYIFELKWDGYRAVAEIEDGNVSLYSRNLLSFNQKYPSLLKILKEVEHNVVFDGEIVVLNEEGHPVFQFLQNYKEEYAQNLCYYIFDILYVDGYDLTELPLVERKKYINQLIEGLPNIRFSDHIEENGKSLFKMAQESKLEGIIAKKANSPYRMGKRSNEWVKIKTSLRQEAVIAGFTEPKGSRKHIGSLVLGVYDNGNLKYIGNAGGGFNDKSLKETKELLEPLIRKTSPFKEKIKTNTPVTWLKPELVCEVEFSEWTQENSMRHPIFQGFREDKDPKDVVIEKPEVSANGKESSKLEKKLKETEKQKSKGGKEEPRADDKIPDDKDNSTSSKAKKKIKSDKEDNSKKVDSKKAKTKDKNKEQIEIDGIPLTLSNLDKIYWPEEKYTKGDLIDYYISVGKYMLPYLEDRPQSLHRHPNGIDKPGFFHKDMGENIPDWLETCKVHSESNDKEINYLLCQNQAALTYMNNLGCIEINPWNSRIQSLENPDFTVIDLDPADNTFEEVIETALVVKSILDKAGAECYIKTSGSSGMHIYIPLGARYDYEQGKNFAHIIAQLANAELPDLTSIERSPKARPKSIYLDYLQNRKGQTLASVYGVRPKSGATVSTPLEWKEVKKGLHPSQFTIKTILPRIKKKGDLFKGILGKGIDMEKCISRLGG